VVDDEPDVAELFRQRFRREARQGTYVMYLRRLGRAVVFFKRTHRETIYGLFALEPR
jgi:hypothetical protein